MNRIARPTDSIGRAKWEQTVRQRRGPKPRVITLVEEPTDLSWEEAVRRIVEASVIISRIAERIERTRAGNVVPTTTTVHNEASD
jgi:hypothetical protein